MLAALFDIARESKPTLLSPIRLAMWTTSCGRILLQLRTSPGSSAAAWQNN